MKASDPHLRVGDLLVRKGSESVYCFIKRNGDKLLVCRESDLSPLSGYDVLGCATFEFPADDLAPITQEAFTKLYRATNSKEPPKIYDLETGKWRLGVGRDDDEVTP